MQLPLILESEERNPRKEKAREREPQILCRNFTNLWLTPELHKGREYSSIPGKAKRSEWDLNYNPL